MGAEMAGENGALENLLRARECLRDVTPLHADCGRICGAACCQGDAEDGMLLFPHEAELYGQADWAHVKPLPKLRDLFGVAPDFLICEGRCPRAERPLACRIFPLTPFLKRKKLCVRMDVRGQTLCPLVDSGVRGLQPEFVRAVGEAMEALYADAEMQRHMLGLTRLIQQSEAVQSLFRI